MIKTLIGMLFILLFCGCNQAYYFKDRRNDLIDFAQINLSGFTFGFSANIGPAVVGCQCIVGIGHCGGGGAINSFGLGGYTYDTCVSTKGDILALIFPFHLFDYSKRTRHNFGGDSKYPAWSSIGFDIGLFYGLGARVDPLEFIDFVLGIAGVDILEDDRNYYSRKYGIDEDQPDVEESPDQ